MAASVLNIIACFALLVSILALQVLSCIDQRGTSTSAGTTTAAGTASASAAPPPFHDGALNAAVLALLAGMDALFIAAAVIYSRHTHHAAVGAGGGGGGGNWRVSELAFFVLCLQVGVLQFVLFAQQPAAAGYAAARAIGTSVASVTFFLGITLIYAHVGNGGGAAGGGVVASNNGPVPAPVTATVRLLANMTLGAALACLMTIVLALFYTNTR